MTSETFNILHHNEDPEITRDYFIDYLLHLLSDLKSNERSAPKTAYPIAGMLSSKFAQMLSDDDPLMEIMILAGELETSPNNASELTWELIQKIEALSNRDS